MKIYRRVLTKRQVLKFYKHIKGITAQEAALAEDLGVYRTTVNRWEMDQPIPKPWSIIIVNLLFRERFGLPAIGE